MIREIVTDTELLAKPLERVESTAEIRELARDLLDTAKFHGDRCLGLAANQIGGTKCVVVVRGDHSGFMLMVNPVIIKRSPQWYAASEGCLSLDGIRKTLRFSWVDVMYRDAKYNIRKIRCAGKLAQIVQHEIDHTNGIII